MSKRHTEQSINQKLPEFVKIRPGTFQSVDIKAVFMDSEFGEWEALPSNVLRGARHPRRRHKETSIRRTIPVKQIATRLPSHIKIDEETYVNRNTRCRFIDEKYGEFWALPNDVIRGDGFSHPLRLVEHLSKIKTLNPEEIQARVSTENPGILMILDSYRGVDKKATFLDPEYGQFTATPSSVIKGGRHPAGRYKRIKDTLMKRYGVTHNSHIPEVAKAMARSSRSVHTRSHWRSGAQVLCQGRLEVAVVDYLNEKKIEYQWQIIFAMPNGKTYRVDLYLPDEDKFVEIKGYFRRPENKEKWEWFHSTHPNSELWTEPKLRALGIISCPRSQFWGRPNKPSK